MRAVNRFLFCCRAVLGGWRGARQFQRTGIRRVCAWCGATLDGLGDVRPGDRVSHGMCLDCAAKQRPILAVDFKRK